MSKKTAATYCVYNDDEWLNCSLSSIYPVVDAIYILISDRPWNGPFQSTEASINCIKEFDDTEQKIKLIRGTWATEVEQRNYGLALLQADNFDYAFIIDADEVYDPASLNNMLHYAYAREEVGCWHCWFIVYWKNCRWRIDPPEQHHPPILLKIGTGGFVEYRNCISEKGSELIPPEIGFCHHLSYARTDEQIKRKLESFSHSHQIDPMWFKNKWKGWDTDKSVSDLCPYNPGVFQRTAEVPLEALPPILQKYYPKDAPKA